jgi:hypothetical protein
MVTIFSIPKPFIGHINTIQTNAIMSWQRLSPRCEIILCGDDSGTAEIANQMGIGHIPDIATNDYGTPFVSDAFRRVQAVARNDRLVYTNADIIFLSDFLPSIMRVGFPRFLLCGQRINIDVDRTLNFDHPDWEVEIRENIKNYGMLDIPEAIDYFIFCKNTLGNLPNFAVGRPGWDNWMIYNARSRRFPVVNVTTAITAIHQNHDYRHVKDKVGPRWEGPEADINIKLGGGMKYMFDLVDATHVLGPDGIQRQMTDLYLMRRASRMGVLSRYPQIILWMQSRLFWLIYKLKNHLPPSLWGQILYSLSF